MRSSARYYPLKRGGQCPSVTTFIQVLAKPLLVPWAAKVTRMAALDVASEMLVDGTMRDPAIFRETFESRLKAKRAADDAADKAANIGKRVHTLIEHHFAGREPTKVDHPDVETCYLQFLDWKKTNDVQLVQTERVVVHEDAEYGGTIDMLADIRGERWLLDFKTSNALYPEHLLQVVAYWHALESVAESEDEVPTRLGVVRLPKDATSSFEVYEVPRDTWSAHQTCFLALKTVWHWSQRFKEIK